MKATEILNKAKELLSIESEEVQLAQATLENGTVIEADEFAEGKEVFIVTEDERVVLVIEEKEINAYSGAEEEAPEEEAPVEEEVEASEEEKEEMAYATKEDLAEVKSMIDEIKAMIDKKDELSVEETVENIVEEAKEELSEVEKVNHNPEAEANKKLNLYAQKRSATTLDRVLAKMNKFNK